MYIRSNIVAPSLNNCCNGKATMRCCVYCLVPPYSQQYKDIESRTKTAFMANLFCRKQYDMVGLYVKCLIFLFDFKQILSFLQASLQCSNIEGNGNVYSGCRAEACRQTTEGQTDGGHAEANRCILRR